MRVRRVEDVEDVRAAYRVNGRAWEAAYADILPEDLVERAASMPVEDELRAHFEAVRDECYLVAESAAGDAMSRGGDVLGYAYARWGEDTKEFVGEGDAGLKELYVDPDHWGEGVGTVLLAAVLERVPDRFDALVLETLAGNDRGRAFYESRGFEAVDEVSVTFGDVTAPAVVYRRELE
ncbi:MAG: N-acetyltransferase family protein [Halobacterium sp.]